MSASMVRTRILQKGLPPTCLKSYRQCRGCYGWRNMLRAARSYPAWQDLPFRCLVTGLTLTTAKRSQITDDSPVNVENVSPPGQKSEAYHKPDTLSQTIDLLLKFNGSARVISGGTDILSRRQGHKKGGLAVQLIDMSGLGLNYIQKEHHTVCIGAATDINHLITSPVFGPDPYNVLAEAARAHSTHTIRNRATVGGNLCTASPGADLLPPLMALDASVILAGPEGEEIIPLVSFLKGVNCTALTPTQLLTEIVIPPQPERSRASFLKLRRQHTAVDMAVVNVATRLSMDHDHCLSARIALGSAGPVSFLAQKAAALLFDRTLTKPIIQEAARMAAEESSPIDDIRASAAYRKEMVAVLVENSLLSSWQRGRDE